VHREQEGKGKVIVLTSTVVEGVEEGKACADGEYVVELVKVRHLDEFSRRGIKQSTGENDSKMMRRSRRSEVHVIYARH